MLAGELGARSADIFYTGPPIISRQASHNLHNGASPNAPPTSLSPGNSASKLREVVLTGQSGPRQNKWQTQRQSPRLRLPSSSLSQAYSKQSKPSLPNRKIPTS